jgi:P4 family phage/plasmid primase-like protien
MEVLKIAQEKHGLVKMESQYQRSGNPNISKVINSFFDKEDLAEQIYNVQPYFYDKVKNWWLWNHNDKCWARVDETDILNMTNLNSIADTIKAKERVEILEAMKQEGRRRIPQPVKPTWIQFKDTIVDVAEGTKMTATPDYFVTNPIPWALHNDNCEDTPNMDRIFVEWVGEDFYLLLFQILAFCLLPDYPINRLFCFIGPGMNGKTKYLELLGKFVGKNNITSTELDILLDSRFEISRLHKKLVCVMGETNFAEMSKTSIIKKLTGGDLIGFEYKGKDPFDDKNYAKVLISTNNLPTTTDKTIGFYRRWLIVDFPNQFTEKIDILSQIPEEEYSCLANKCIKILKALLIDRKFHKEGSVEDRMKKFEDKSNPFDKFWKEFIEEDGSAYIFKYDFERKFNDWCRDNRFREFSETTIGLKMKDRGVDTIRRDAEWLSDGLKRKALRAWAGITWKDTIEKKKDL